MNNRYPWVAGIVVAAVAFAAASAGGCKESGADPSDPKVVEQMRAKLADADAADGTTDKVVSQCAGCSLRMDGSDEHTLTAHGYPLHFCSADCRDRFHEHLTRAILDLKIPEPGGR